MIKIAAEVLKTHMATLFNYLVNQDIFPNNLKIALMHPIHKGTSKLVCSNYRLISILPILSKIYEKLMYKRLNEFKKKETLHNSQFGFQKGKSTEHAILDRYTNVIQSIEKQKRSSCIFLYFDTFDAVDHKILLKKLDYYGIRGISLRWFDYYLANRKQAVKIGLNHSSFKTVVCGVPQESVLEPLLFLIYINDIHISSSKIKFHLFADDTHIFHYSKNFHTLENEVNGALKNISD